MTMVLAHGKVSDSGLITGPTGLGDLTLNNLQRPSLQEPYRFTGSAAVITVDIYAAQNINFAALIGHSCDAAATCVVSGGATPSADDFSLGSFPMQSQLEATGGLSGPFLFRNVFFQLFPAIAYRYWKFTITVPGAVYTDIGRLYLSYAFQPTFNMVYGMTQGFEDLSTEYVTLSGDSLSQKRSKRKVSEFSLEDLSEDESYFSLLPFDYLIGTNTDVLFIPKPSDKRYLQLSSIYGKMTELAPVAWSSWNTFKKQYKITELPS